MKRILLAGVTAVALAASGQAFAQTATVEIAPEQRTKIKEYVVKEKVRPVTISERISVGATLPADVQLQTVPTAWGPSISKFRYVYHDNNVVLVEPSSRRVVEIIKSKVTSHHCRNVPVHLAPGRFIYGCCERSQAPALRLRSPVPHLSIALTWRIIESKS